MRRSPQARKEQAKGLWGAAASLPKAQLDASVPTLKGVKRDSNGYGKHNKRAETAVLCRGVHAQQFLCMEACAGSGMLSCQLKAHGFDVLAVDFSGNKHRPFVGIVKLDLRLVSWVFLRYVANSRRIALFHAGPPCGTSSRARGKPLANGEPGPQPLRSVDWPLGLPDLQGVDKLKVLSANAIYLQVAAFCKELQAQGVLWCVENPTRSIMWEIRDYVELQQFGWFVDFHACRHGTGRRKATSFLTNVQTFKALGLLCEGGHDHASWDPQLVDGKWTFATALEAAYPRLLCDRMAEQLLLQLGVDAGPAPTDRSKVDAAVQKQPKGRKFPPLIPEHVHVVQVKGLLADEPKLNDKNCLATAYGSVPVQAKLLRCTPLPRERMGGKDSAEECVRVFGIFHTPSEFVNLAINLEHPFDVFTGVPDVVAVNLFNLLVEGPLVIAARRLRKIREWKALAVDLDGDEKAFKQTLHPEVAQVLAASGFCF